MPQKNVVKAYKPDTFYHVYNHTVGGFNQLTDWGFGNLFLSLLDRYLGSKTYRDTNGCTYLKLTDKVDVLTYCIMSNHFHLLLKNTEIDGVNKLLKRTMTAYSKVINSKSERRGALFETTFKAVEMKSEAQLLHVSRYIHLNPLDAGIDYETYVWSSYPSFVDGCGPDWLKKEYILAYFKNNQEYMRFVRDGVENHISRK